MTAVTPSEAQELSEWQVHGLGVLGDSTFVGAGAGLGIRLGRRIWLRAGATPGVLEDELSLRSELLVIFHFSPSRSGGLGFYGGGGASVTFRSSESEEFAVVLLGVESQPGAAGNWFGELGLGGGLRIAAGYRRRLGTSP